MGEFFFFNAAFHNAKSLLVWNFELNHKNDLSIYVRVMLTTLLPLLLVLQCPRHLSLYNLHAYDIISLCAGQFQKISPEYTSLNYTCKVSRLQIKNFTSQLLTPDGNVWATITLTGSLYIFSKNYSVNETWSNARKERLMWLFILSLSSPILIEKAVKDSEKTRLWNTSVRLRNVLRHLRILVVPYENSWHSKIKNVTPTTEKKNRQVSRGGGYSLI